MRPLGLLCLLLLPGCAGLSRPLSLPSAGASASPAGPLVLASGGPQPTPSGSEPADCAAGRERVLPASAGAYAGLSFPGNVPSDEAGVDAYVHDQALLPAYECFLRRYPDAVAIYFRRHPASMAASPPPAGPPSAATGGTSTAATGTSTAATGTSTATTGGTSTATTGGTSTATTGGTSTATTGGTALAPIQGVATFAPAVATPAAPPTQSDSGSGPALALSTSPSTTAAPDQAISLVVATTDAGGGALRYGWTATGGTLSGVEGARASWTPPRKIGAFSATVVVTDARGLSATATQSLAVGADGVARLEAAAVSRASSPAASQAPAPVSSTPVPTPTPATTACQPFGGDAILLGDEAGRFARLSAPLELRGLGENQVTAYLDAAQSQPSWASIKCTFRDLVAVYGAIPGKVVR